MISCVNPFVLSLQCFSFKSCDMGLAQLCHHGVIVVQHILNILRNCGVTTTQEFDAYVEDYDW